ncbi:hypothetical protein M7I_5122 [Glarea lozoyensis 74030]|uniref:Uncharacterized protein n=1 Tax=Glarea lozoyensis (strain ATCC 74030 / MF5533) TaxID=1104152 RepID=H0ER11_GLAL7|nr:hypothetical protein M7I_5122 [Glarea lozoyensis 74030]
MSRHQALLQEDVCGVERDNFAAELEKATKYCAAWDQRRQELEAVLASEEVEIKKVCDCTDPDALSKAFESKAIERENELLEIWRKASKTEKGDGLIKMVEENPDYKSSSKGLDRSSVPATPDPAAMNYGRAIAMFGVPDEPGKDQRQESESAEPLDLPPQTDRQAILPRDSPTRDERRKTLIAQLKAWEAPEDFDNGSSNHPDPRQFYNGPPLALLDLQKLGLNENVKNFSSPASD